jgi:60 kDa SS-A/Ro ribonucleoprotein
MGGTDCAAPMQWALKNKKAIDVFIVYTDCDLQPTETHPADTLRKYRDAMNIKDARYSK